MKPLYKESHMFTQQLKTVEELKKWGWELQTTPWNQWSTDHNKILHRGRLVAVVDPRGHAIYFKKTEKE